MASNKLLSRKRAGSVARLVRRVALSACLAGLLVLVEGCGGGSSTAQTEVTSTPTLSTISVTPANPSIAAGTTQQLKATGSYSNGSQQDLTATASWASSAPAIATINSSGLASGVSTGQTTITATSGTVKGSTGLSVTAAVLVSIAVTPSTASVLVGTTEQFTATGKYTDNSTQDISSSVSWSSSAPDVATVSSSGLATILASGKTSINASLGSVSAPAVSLTAEPPGTLGSALATTIACPITDPPSTISGTCYQVAISCPSIIDFNGYVKVTYPTGTPLGTIAFSTGGNGTTLYEAFTYGDTTLNTVLQGGYTVAQISWAGPFNSNQPKGWQTGPGGIRAVSCRYATIAQWIYSNIHLANKSAPFCATGNSGGAEVIGLALAHYGLGSIFAMVEPTSGPPFAHQDWACDCLQPSTTNPCGISQGYCVGLEDAQNFVDPAYEPTITDACSEEVQTGDTSHDALFLSDSILSPDAVLNYPNTFVNFLYGTLDSSTAPNQGHLWEEAITSSKAEACVAMAPHNMPDSLEGAQQIASDLLQFCKLP